jgi:hypothetical protein
MPPAVASSYARNNSVAPGLIGIPGGFDTVGKIQMTSKREIWSG